MKIKFAAAFGVAACFAFPAFSQGDALLPRDYSPTEDVPIRVVSISEREIGVGSIVVVAVGNRTSEPKTARVDCSLYDGAGSPMGSYPLMVQMIPPNSEVVEEADTFMRGVERVFCRVSTVRDARSRRSN